MKGDFSRWDKIKEQNLNGVLHQQGRVLLDRDWNDQTQLVLDWQDSAAKQIIGVNVAAISTQEPNAFKVTHAQVETGKVKLEIHPGQGWADGLAVTLPGESKVTRMATYLEPPIQDPSGKVSDITNGIRDAVILEVWREELNAFQLPNLLIEPALGGPDTTERVLTSMRFQLFRLAPDEDCHNIIDKLQNGISTTGKLTASLQPTTEIDGDCPVVEGGGYTGFEHHLYRVEIAQVNGDVPMFKWSQFNGGLVGRGKCDLGSPDKRITLTANDQAIKMSGLTDFYLEVVELDVEQGFWRVTYGAEVTLNGDDLVVSAERYFEPTLPSEKVFFRLWNGISAIAFFPKVTSPAEPNPLRDGIRLEFDNPDTTYYRPGDYWTFKVRAGEIVNETILIDDKPPQGIDYHRVPLAELNWDADLAISFEDEQIEDCRDFFQPLTRQKGCCSFTVGDGKTSHGDFNSIDDAIRHLPNSGGKICVLPGIHQANVTITNRHNISITGCGVHTIIHPQSDKAIAPIFRIEFSQNIHIENLTLANLTGTAIQVIDTEITRPRATQQSVKLKDSAGIHIFGNQITASIHAIEIRVRNETQAGDNDIWIAHNQIYLLDKPTGKAAIFSIADDVLIERNRIIVIPPPQPDDPKEPRQPNDISVDVFDPCKKPQFYYTAQFPIYQFLQATFLYVAQILAVNKPIYQAQGGIQIGSSSDGVKIINNEIIGGWGNGITLGHLPSGVFDDRTSRNDQILIAKLASDRLKKLQENFVSYLYSIAIAENVIHRMGLSGIGVVSFMKLETVQLMVQVDDLTIYRNQITNCAQQIPDRIPNDLLTQVGFGGIALAGCDRTIIQENRIENNGISYVDPICGIFILFGDKIDITNNLILNNGKIVDKTPQKIAKPGLRGGIFIAISLVSKPGELMSKIYQSFKQNLPYDDGIPAVKVHSNVVTQPLGQALFIAAIGPVSVVGNQFTSQDVDRQADFFTFIGGAVFILNLGYSIQELFGLLLSAKTWARSSFNPAPVAGISGNQIDLKTDFLQNLLYGLFWPSGKVIFNDNQTTLDLRDTQSDLMLSSQFIFSLDDIGFSSNQSDCNLLVDVMLTNTWIIGFSVRTNDNRFREGLIFAFLSLFSFGILNTNTNNQGSHCFLALASLTKFRVDQDNIVLFDQLCNPLVKRLTEQYG
jgi:Right handed beta helix region/Family of unknown function (DUF6519)